MALQLSVEQPLDVELIYKSTKIALESYEVWVSIKKIVPMLASVKLYGVQ